MRRGGARRGAARGATADGREWWRGLDGDDVISLEPLCELAYEPFSLPASGGEAAGASVDAYNYFDGKILSCYLISSGNFVHPVSRRPLARAECERLDTYMQLHGLGNAGVTHVFDLKADTSGGRMPLVPRARACPAPASSSASRVRAHQEPACWPACGPRSSREPLDGADNSQQHVQALQREASDILQSLFSASTFARTRSRRPGLADPPRAQGAGGTGNADRESGWTVIDDDEEMAVAMSRQTEEQNWPALPAAPERPAAADPPPAQDWAAAGAHAAGGDEDAGDGPDATGIHAAARPPQPRWPQTDPGMPTTRADVLAPVVDVACVRGGVAGSKEGGGFWSKGAWEALEAAGCSGAGALVALERQMGGVAQDPRFSSEIAWVDSQVEGRVGAAHSAASLAALGFSVVRIVALFRQDLEAEFVSSVVSSARQHRASLGWSVWQVPEGERNGGLYYAWNSLSGHSCWSLPDALHQVDQGDVRRTEETAGWGGERVVGGCRTRMTWAALGPDAMCLAAKVGGGARTHQTAFLDSLAAAMRGRAQASTSSPASASGAQDQHLEAALVEAARNLGLGAHRRAREDAGGHTEQGLVQGVQDIGEGQVLQVLACREVQECGSLRMHPTCGEETESETQARAAAYPLLLVSVKRLVRTPRPRISPPAGVHEGSVVVSLESPPGGHPDLARRLALARRHWVLPVPTHTRVDTCMHMQRAREQTC